MRSFLNLFGPSVFARTLFASIIPAPCGIPTIALCVVLFGPRPGAIAADVPAGKGPLNPIDLSQRYPASLDHAPARTGYDWTCDAKDVWRVTEFTLSMGHQFRVETKAAQVVLGHHESNVLWAAVFPDQPGGIVTASAGQGEHITSIWLRFHPARLRELFPPSTVTRAGAAELIADAKRLAAHKMRACWQAGGKPMVPDRAVITVDLETREGPRRFFSIDTDNSTAKYFDAFKGRPLTVAKTVDRDLAREVFDAVWNAFDREYAMFVLKPGVDWPKLRDEFRARASAAKDSAKLAELLAEMLAHLQDLHVAVRVGGAELPVYQRHRPLNANRQAVPKLLGPVMVAGHDLSWCVTADGIGYVAIDRLTDPGLSQAFDDVLENLERTRGLILDLRFNGGGSEPLGQEIAGSFLDGIRVYAKSQYRNGPRHADLTPPIDRKCRPKDPWHYVAPVIVLQGQRTMSSAEALVLMLSQCPQVTTLGDRTAGSSGNPRVLKAGAGISVNLPRWIDLDAQGKPIDAVGIRPQVVVNAKEADFTGDADPVLAAALERLRAQKFQGPALTLRVGAVRPQQRPRVVAVTPARDAVGIDPLTEIRIRFDRPMNPRNFDLQWKPIRGARTTKIGFRLRKAVRYEAERNEFVFPVRLTPGVAHRIEVVSDDPHFAAPSIQRLFQSADGVPANAYEWQFRTRDEGPEIQAGEANAAVENESERKSRLAAAARSESLQALVAKVRQRRRALKSAVERVDDRTQWTEQPHWFRNLQSPRSARFWVEGKSHFRADASLFFFAGVPLQVGGDDRNCWSRIGDHLIIGPADAIKQKNVLIADPLHSASDETDETVIKELQLEYVGDVQQGDRTCVRLRSWRTARTGRYKPDYDEWLIDKQTLLPVAFEEFGSNPLRYEFAFDSIDKDLPAATFAPPTDAGLAPSKPDSLGDGYDQHFVNALDGSAGRLSVRWGKTGTGRTSSSGLN